MTIYCREVWVWTGCTSWKLSCVTAIRVPFSDSEGQWRIYKSAAHLLKLPRASTCGIHLTDTAMPEGWFLTFSLPPSLPLWLPPFLPFSFFPSLLPSFSLFPSLPPPLSSSLLSFFPVLLSYLSISVSFFLSLDFKPRIYTLATHLTSWLSPGYVSMGYQCLSKFSTRGEP